MLDILSMKFSNFTRICLSDGGSLPFFFLMGHAPFSLKIQDSLYFRSSVCVCVMCGMVIVKKM